MSLLPGFDMRRLQDFMKFVSGRTKPWDVQRPWPATQPPLAVPVKAPVEIIRPQGKLLQFRNNFNGAASHLDRAAIKGYLKAAFTGAALNTAAKLTLSAAIRSTDFTMGGASAIAGGVTGIWDDVRADFRQARTNALPGHAPLGRAQAVKQVWAQHRAKYGKKFALGAASGFAGAWGMDIAFDNADVLKGWYESCTTWIGDRLKEWTPPALRDFTIGLSAWFGERYTDIREKCTALKNWLLPKSPANDFTAPLRKKMSPLPDMGLPSAVESLELPEQTPAPPAAEIVEDQPAPGIVEEISEEPPPAELTPKQQLAALLDTSEPGTRLDDTVYSAIKGKAWAQNELIDGLYNGRYGFEKNRELAVKLAAEWSAPIKEQLVAHGAGSLSEGQKQLLLNLAYIEYNPANAALGIAHNPQDALDIIAKLERSWTGAPELAQQFADANDVITETEISPVNAEVASEIAPETPETLSCRAQQNPPGTPERFDIACDPFKGKLKPGDTISLGIDFSNGVHNAYTLDVGPAVIKTSNEEYLEQALFSVLSQAQPPETTPILTASQ